MFTDILATISIHITNPIKLKINKVKAIIWGLLKIFTVKLSVNNTMFNKIISVDIIIKRGIFFDKSNSRRLN